MEGAPRPPLCAARPSPRRERSPRLSPAPRAAAPRTPPLAAAPPRVTLPGRLRPAPSPPNGETKEAAGRCRAAGAAPALRGAPRTRARREEARGHHPLAAPHLRAHPPARARAPHEPLTSPTPPVGPRPARLAPRRRLPLVAPPGGREPAAYMKGRGGRGARPLRARWAPLASFSPVAAAARGSVPRRPPLSAGGSTHASSSPGRGVPAGPVRTNVRSFPPPPARSPWPAGRPRTATATGRSSSGTQRRRSFWAAPGAAGVSAGPGAAGTAARSATPPSPAAGLRRGRGLRAYRGGAGVQVGRGGVGRPWRGRLVLGAPSPASPRRAGGRPPGCAPLLPLYPSPEEGHRAACASPRESGCPFARPRGRGGGSVRRCSPSRRASARGAPHE